MIKKWERGAGIVEYALLIVLVAVAAILVLTAFGGTTSGLLGGSSSSLKRLGVSTSATIQIITDWQARERAYIQQHGSWPRTWSPYNFTDIGLNPADWSQPVNGLILSPHGNEVGITAGPNYQVYVKDLNGNTLHLVTTWAIWCPVGDSNCYYHTVAPGNEVNISTLYVTGP